MDWLSIVAALIVDRHGPAISSAARRKTATRSCHGVRDHAGCAAPGGGDRALDLSRASLLDVRQHVRAAMRHHCLERRPRLDALAADHHRDVHALGGHLREPAAQLGALGRARRVAPDRLVDRRRRTEDAGCAHAADCIVDGVRVTRHPYEVPGWGVGEVWVCDGVLVQHELACEALRLEYERGDAAPDPFEAPGRRGRWADGSGTQAGPGRARRLLPPPMGERGAQRERYRAAASRDRAAFVADLCRRFAAHLDGVATSYADVPLELEWATPLQRELAVAARAIPWGEVVSYGELAALAGRPGAARAAGSFCADNRFSLIIPCHRVVAANGIGGYGSAGPELKRRLLALEGVRL